MLYHFSLWDKFDPIFQACFCASISFAFISVIWLIRVGLQHAFFYTFTYSSVMQCVAVCCSVAVCFYTYIYVPIPPWCSALQCVAVCCSVALRFYTSIYVPIPLWCNALQSVAVLQCISTHPSMRPPQCDAVRCSVLQFVAVLQCVSIHLPMYPLLHPSLSLPGPLSLSLSLSLCNTPLH